MIIRLKDIPIETLVDGVISPEEFWAKHRGSEIDVNMPVSEFLRLQECQIGIYRNMLKTAGVTKLVQILPYKEESE